MVARTDNTRRCGDYTIRVVCCRATASVVFWRGAGDLCILHGTMVITYHGGQCFRVSFGDTTLAFDPIDKSSKTFTAVKFGSDIALVSLRHPDCNGIQQVTHGTKTPFVIDGPGEYEVGDVTVRGFGVPTTYENVSRINTIYQVQLEQMNIVFLGALGSAAELESSILGELGDIDILFVPIGGGDVLDVPQASKLGVKLEAKLVIPMRFDKNAHDAFLKEEGVEKLTPVDKLTVKKRDVSVMEGEIVVLAAK